MDDNNRPARLISRPPESPHKKTGRHNRRPVSLSVKVSVTAQLRPVVPLPPEVTHVFHRQVRRHQYQHALARYGRDKQVDTHVPVAVRNPERYVPSPLRACRVVIPKAHRIEIEHFDVLRKTPLRGQMNLYMVGKNPEVIEPRIDELRLPVGRLLHAVGIENVVARLNERIDPGGEALLPEFAALLAVEPLHRLLVHDRMNGHIDRRLLHKRRGWLRHRIVCSRGNRGNGLGRLLRRQERRRQKRCRQENAKTFHGRTGSIELGDRAVVLHGVVPGVGDGQRRTAHAGIDLEREGVIRRRIERGGEGHHPSFVRLLGHIPFHVGHRIVQHGQVVRRHVSLDVGEENIHRPVPVADVEIGVHDLAERPGRHALHGLRVELEVARENQRVHILLEIGLALGTPFFARFTALLLGRKGLLPLSDDRVADGTRQDESDGNKENLFHGT